MRRVRTLVDEEFVALGALEAWGPRLVRNGDLTPAMQNVAADAEYGQCGLLWGGLWRHCRCWADTATVKITA